MTKERYNELLAEYRQWAKQYNFIDRDYNRSIRRFLIARHKSEARDFLNYQQGVIEKSAGHGGEHLPSQFIKSFSTIANVQFEAGFIQIELGNSKIGFNRIETGLLNEPFPFISWALNEFLHGDEKKRAADLLTLKKAVRKRKNLFAQTKETATKDQKKTMKLLQKRLPDLIEQLELSLSDPQPPKVIQIFKKPIDALPETANCPLTNIFESNDMANAFWQALIDWNWIDNAGKWVGQKGYLKIITDEIVNSEIDLKGHYSKSKLIAELFLKLYGFPYAGNPNGIKANASTTQKLAPKVFRKLIQIKKGKNT